MATIPYDFPSRVGNKQKKIDISIPKLDHFIHKVYIHVARKVYMNVYLFEKNISPLLIQKNNRELEMIVQECISSVGSQADKAYLKKHFGLSIESDIVYPAAEESWSVKSQYSREYNFPP